MKRVHRLAILLVIIFCLLPVMVFAWPVPDTGQTKCYNKTVEIACPSPGQPFYGQDANYSIHPMSYTKLDANGVDLPDSATFWVMVRDNVTGLIWENKTDDGTIHDKDNLYTWYDSNSATNGGNAGSPGDGTDTEDFIKALNDAHFGGYSGWRLPTAKELSYIVNCSIPFPGPTIDTVYFPNTKSGIYWSSTTQAGSSLYAWGVQFLYNGADEFIIKYNLGYVRAVCGGPAMSLGNLAIGSFDAVDSGLMDDASTSAGGYTDNLDGTVTDTSTGLMWHQTGSSERMTWEQALAYCEGLNFDGYTDWRMPTKKELKSLVDYSCYNPAINCTYFPDMVSVSHWYSWSSTTHAAYTQDAWEVSFEYGLDSFNDKTPGLTYVRAVRGGQAGSLGHLVISSPKQASAWDGGALMLICWGTEGLGTNVKISLSRQGGLDGSFETIVDTTPNDGQYEWTITGPASVNCVIKIEQTDNTSNWATEGLFVIETQCHPCDLDCDGDVDILDIMMVAARWNTKTDDLNYAALCDLDNDGDIDIIDIMMVAAQWGWSE